MDDSVSTSLPELPEIFTSGYELIKEIKEVFKPLLVWYSNNYFFLSFCGVIGGFLLHQIALRMYRLKSDKVMLLRKPYRNGVGARPSCCKVVGMYACRVVEKSGSGTNMVATSWQHLRWSPPQHPAKQNLKLVFLRLFNDFRSWAVLGGLGRS